MNSPQRLDQTEPIRDIIVIGAPVGGGAALAVLIGCFPPDLGASLFVVLQATVDSPILLADVLNAPGRMRATEAIHGERIERRRIYVAADEKHLMIREGKVHLSSNGVEHPHRPSIDLLFMSAAETYKARVVGVLLVNANRDGLLGLHAIREAGGRTVTHRNEQMPEGPTHRETGELLSHHHVDLAAIAPCVLAYVSPADANGSTDLRRDD